jgi:hypothetical protein
MVHPSASDGVEGFAEPPNKRMKRDDMTLLLGLCFLVGGVGCEQSSGPSAVCPAIATAGLDVGVASERTGEPLCDATVTATDGSYSEQLAPVSCRYFGAFEGPATYVLRAERAGFQAKEVRDVRVSMGTGQCPHVNVVHLDIQLSPMP